MLSDLMVRQAKATGKTYTLADSDGLSFFVSANGTKAWHFRFTWGSRRDRMSFGSYPALSLKEARELRDEARTLLAKGVNPHTERKRKRHAIVLAGEHTFQAVYDQWLKHRKLSLEEGRQTSLEQIARVFKKDEFPVLRHLTIYDITRAHLLDIIGKVEKRGSLSVAEKLRTWFTQLFTYATVTIPNMHDNPSKDLEVVALPLPPVEHNPFLRMPELPIMLQTLRKYRGRLNTQLGIRLLMLTGVRTGELRFATPDQFDLEQGLWIIPVARLKQRALLTKKKRKRLVGVSARGSAASLGAQRLGCDPGPPAPIRRDRAVERRPCAYRPAQGRAGDGRRTGAGSLHHRQGQPVFVCRIGAAIAITAGASAPAFSWPTIALSISLHKGPFSRSQHSLQLLTSYPRKRVSGE